MANLHLSTLSPMNRFQAMRPTASSDANRWMSMAAAFADTGGLVGGDELADLIRHQSLHNAALQISQPVSLVARWIVSGRAISMDSPWGIVLPLFQFDLERGNLHPEVPMVRAELGDVLQGPEVALWFVTPNQWLGGDRPVEALHTRLPQVRRAARHVAHSA